MSLGGDLGNGVGRSVSDVLGLCVEVVMGQICLNHFGGSVRVSSPRREAGEF